nr:MAG TPA: hypothetical protein [Caudoviricetes sp.]
MPTNRLSAYRLHSHHIKNKSGGAIPKKGNIPKFGVCKIMRAMPEKGEEGN